MFDSVTEDLIRRAEPLDGLDLNNLPQILTEAYAQVVAVRLDSTRLSNERSRKEWSKTLLDLRRLAETYEGLTIFLPSSNPHRESCAFVAGAAHHTLAQARQIQNRFHGTPVSLPSLSPHRIGPEVSACLLFLIAGQQADSAEASTRFVDLGAGPAAAELTRGIAAIASGDGQRILDAANMRLLESLGFGGEDYIHRAAERMWSLLLEAIRQAARRSMDLPLTDEPLDLVEEVIRRIQETQTSVQIGNRVAGVRAPLEGPYHLARLLREVIDTLLSSAVTRLKPPDGAESKGWTQFRRHFARRRPFLWRNHIAAINEGFLASGRSSVLTFPTGAGKTTITELRIAAELLRGRKVVYLAPTRALVDQVAREVSRSVRPIGENVVRGRFLEDFGERATGQVYVHTPEQCLAYLSFEPEAHRDLGLIVVDECHQISGEHDQEGDEERLPGQRPIDAKWTLLSLMHRSPDADIILISAMVRNAAELASWLQAVTGRPASALDLGWKPTRQVRGVVVYDEDAVNGLKSELQRRRVDAFPRTRPNASEKRSAFAMPVGLFCHTQVWSKNSSFARFPMLSSRVPLAVNDYWGLSANRNVVGALLLSAMARAGMRPIVFTQQIGWTASIAKTGSADLKKKGVQEIKLNEREIALFSASAIELGGREFVHLPHKNRVGVHHGLLLISERMAVESAFRRADGLLALVATPTVAQGINLPAEAVIIAGDDRWTGDMGEGSMQPLAVHELLNAAGRAGRAGHFAHGIVIDIPGQVFTVSQKNDTYYVDGLDHIMSLFGLPDQCLDVIDPITQVIDRISMAGAEGGVSEYLVRRAGGLDLETLRAILRSTLGNNRLSSSEEVVERQVQTLRRIAQEMEDEDEGAEADIEFWREAAGQVGVSPGVLASIAARMPPASTVESWGFPDFIAFAFGELLKVEGQLFGLVDPHNSDLARVLPRKRVRRGRIYVPDETPEQWEVRLQGTLLDVLPGWLRGDTIAEIGSRIHTHRGATNRVKAIDLGRRFALQCASGIAHAISVVRTVFEGTRGEHTPVELTAQIPLAPGCVREGFDLPDKLLLFWHLRRYPGLYPRVVTHRVFETLDLNNKLPSWRLVPGLEDRRDLIRALIGSKPPVAFYE